MPWEKAYWINFSISGNFGQFLAKKLFLGYFLGLKLRNLKLSYLIEFLKHWLLLWVCDGPVMRWNVKKQKFEKFWFLWNFYFYGVIFQKNAKSLLLPTFFVNFSLWPKNIGPEKVSWWFSAGCFSVAHKTSYQRSCPNQPICNFSYLEWSELESSKGNPHYLWKICHITCIACLCSVWNSRETLAQGVAT